MSLRRAHFLLFDEDRVWGLLTTPAALGPGKYTYVRPETALRTVEPGVAFAEVAPDVVLRETGRDS